MRVCIERSTGKLIESQSGDHAAYGVLLGNAVSAGYAAEDVEEKVVTQDAFDALWLAAIPPATYADNRRAAYPDIGDQLDALYHAGVFPADMTAKIKAVKDANPKS
tara:strand:+ start:797 stop:1114 length:318 start_codon:yes stop_codon:yes gene_type:complete